MDNNQIWFLTDSWLNIACDMVCCCTCVCFYLYMCFYLSFFKTPGPVMCFTMESPIIQTCLRDFLFLFSFSWGSLISASDDNIVSDVSIFLLSIFLFLLRPLFSFPLRTDFIKLVLFCVGRVRFVMIDSSKVVLFF